MAQGKLVFAPELQSKHVLIVFHSDLTFVYYTYQWWERNGYLEMTIGLKMMIPWITQCLKMAERGRSCFDYWKNNPKFFSKCKSTLCNSGSDKLLCLKKQFNCIKYCSKFFHKLLLARSVFLSNCAQSKLQFRCSVQPIPRLSPYSRDRCLARLLLRNETAVLVRIQW